MTVAPLIIPGDHSRTLAHGIAEALNSRVVDVMTKRFDDNEVKTRIEENIRGRDVVVVASAAGHPDEQEKETRLLLRAAVKRCDAKSVTLLVPYMWYGRSDDNWGERNEPALMDTIETLRPLCDKVVVADPHNALMVREKFAEAAKTNVVHFAYPYAVQLRAMIEAGIITRESLLLSHADSGSTKRISPTFRACVYSTLQLEGRKAEQDDWAVGLKDRDKVTGKSYYKGFDTQVKGRDVVIFEDMIASGGTAMELADMLKGHGARSVILFATSGLFTTKPGQAPDASVKRLDASKTLDAVFITDTYDHAPVTPSLQAAIDASPLIHTVKTAPYLASIIRALYADAVPERMEDNSISSILNGSHKLNGTIASVTPYKPGSPLLRLKGLAAA